VCEVSTNVDMRAIYIYVAGKQHAGIHKVALVQANMQLGNEQKRKQLCPHSLCDLDTQHCATLACHFRKEQENIKSTPLGNHNGSLLIIILIILIIINN